MSTSLAPGLRSASPDVVDLSSARQARQSPSAAWVCAVCDLVAEGFLPSECAYLAAVHDQVQHGSRQTARIVLGAAARPGADIDACPGRRRRGSGPRHRPRHRRLSPPQPPRRRPVVSRARGARPTALADQTPGPLQLLFFGLSAFALLLLSTPARAGRGLLRLTVLLSGGITLVSLVWVGALLVLLPIGVAGAAIAGAQGAVVGYAVAEVVGATLIWMTFLRADAEWHTVRGGLDRGPAAAPRAERAGARAGARRRLTRSIHGCSGPGSARRSGAGRRRPGRRAPPTPATSPASRRSTTRRTTTTAPTPARSCGRGCRSRRTRGAARTARRSSSGGDGGHLLALMLTSKDHDRDVAAEARHGRHWVDLGAGGWDPSGRPSEVRVDRVLRLDAAAVRRVGAVLDRQRYDVVTREARRVLGWDRSAS